ncbi:MAG: hypothetical protein AAGF60_09570 [Pseudomonadota bacterium]
MSRHSGKPPLPGFSDEAGPSSNVKLLLIAAGFLVVTIGLVVLQPGRSPAPDTLADSAAPVQSLRPEAPTEVSRASAGLLDPVSLPSASEAVSRQLRQPIRLTQTSGQRRDLPGLARAVLADFGHDAAEGDRLHALLVEALAQRQSNAYIDALLNTAAARGEFRVPQRLAARDGRLDTPVLLAALVERSAN